MNYEKKYKETFERATATYKDADRHLKATLERIFPELKENEDEKIRYYLINFVKINDGVNLPPDYAKKSTFLARKEKILQISVTVEAK